MVAHELRTPMTGLSGALQLLGACADKGDCSPERQRELLGIATRSAGRLEVLVTELTVLRDSDMGVLAVDRDEICPREVLTDVAERLRPLARGRGVELEVVAETPPELGVQADPALLRQALSELVINAIKVSPSGARVTLEVRALGGAVRFTINDEGPGIPLGERERIFERFVQVDSSTKRKLQGAGLGLAVCKAIADGHGARLAVDEGAGGRGAAFSLDLQTADPQQARA